MTTQVGSVVVSASGAKVLKRNVVVSAAGLDVLKRLTRLGRKPINPGFLNLPRAARVHLERELTRAGAIETVSVPRCPLTLKQTANPTEDELRRWHKWQASNPQECWQVTKHGRALAKTGSEGGATVLDVYCVLHTALTAMTEEQRQSLRELVKADELFSARDGLNLMELHFAASAERLKNARRRGTRNRANEKRDALIVELRAAGKSYGQIAKLVRHLDPDITPRAVGKAIQRRKKGAHQTNGHRRAD